MYCSKCGKENPDQAKFCSSCGNVLNLAESIIQNTSEPGSEINQQSKNLKIGWIILSVLIPFAGFAIYFNLKSTYPKKANDAITSAGIGMIINFILLML